jgi:hypothetical protein
VYNSAADNKDNAIVQYSLNEAGDKIINERIIEKGNELFHEPTTAALLGNKLYVVANSYLTTYNANHESVKGIEEKLGPVAGDCLRVEVTHQTSNVKRGADCALPITHSPLTTHHSPFTTHQLILPKQLATF